MASQNAQMAHKVEVIDEVKTRLAASTASIVSEYRGLTVAEMAELRVALARSAATTRSSRTRSCAGDRRRRVPAAGGVPERPERADLRQGDISAVAKALRDFSRANPHLVIKGGLADGSLLSTSTWPRWPTCPPARSCWPAWPARWPHRCSTWPGCSRPCRRTSPTGSRRCGISVKAGGERSAEADATAEARAAAEAAAPAHATASDAAPAEEAAAEPAESAAEADGGAEAADTRRRGRRGAPSRRPPSGSPRPPTTTDRDTRTEGKKGRPGRCQP